MKTNATILASVMLLAIVVIVALQSPASGQNSDPRQSHHGGLQNGRFLLYQGQYEVTNRLPGKKGEHDSHMSAGMFKIDTATGRVWKYDESIGAANSVRSGWTEIEGR